MEWVVGLGNPGSRYAETRHNLGYRVVDRLASRSGAAWRVVDPSAQVASLRLAGPVAREVGLVKPTSYMNRSGEALDRVRQLRPARPEEILIVLDDVYLPFGRLRLRAGGADGGHNGLSSVQAALGSREVPRLRCGIGPCPEGVALEEFVLEPFTPAELEQLEPFVDRAAQVVAEVLEKGVAGSQNLVASLNSIVDESKE